jgi:predicted HAD superfamily hydrolase
MSTAEAQVRYRDQSEDLAAGQQRNPVSFEELHKFVEAKRTKDRSKYTSADRLYPAFLDTLPEVDVVSFDIFDTALIRYVDHPVDVFFHLAQHPAFKAHRFAQPVSRQRIAAESTARKMVFGLISSSEVNLLEIYQVFCDLNGISREFAEGFVAAEEQIELNLCIPCLPIQRLAEEAASAGKRVLFVSDTYHTADFLLRLLRNIGYSVKPEDIFASSVSRKSKQGGDLFPEVLAAAGIAPERVLHLGDHPISDYTKAFSAGLNAILHPHKASRETSDLLFASSAQGKNSDDRSLGQMSVVRGIIRAAGQTAEDRGHGDDFWWKFGYRSAGPLTVGFCQWLEHGLRSEGIEHACFLLRDGELLFQVYQALFRDDPSACSASRLASSRRAMLLPTVGFAPMFAIPSLFAGIGLRPVREYLDRLGIDAEPFEEEALAAGFSSLDERIDGRNDTNRLLQFFTQNSVLRTLLDRGNREREALVAYLRQQGLLDHSRVALVDLGWTGTIHKCLHVLLGRVAPGTRLTGYYLATFPDAEHTIIPGVERRSYLATAGEPFSVYAKIQSFLNLFETVYTSTEGSTLYFESAPGGHAAAVHQQSDKSPEQCSNLNAMHAGALAFAEDFRRIAAGFDFPPMPPELASDEFFRVIERPTFEEARLLGGLVHCDNLGSMSTHVSAGLRPGGDPASLLEDLAESNWKQGVISLPTPEAAALRTLLWLMETQPC